MAEGVSYEHNRTMFRDAPGQYIAAVISIPLVVGIFALWAWYIRARCETLLISADRVIYNKGVFARDHVEMFLDNIRSVRIDQTFFQRIFNVGDIFITSSGSTPEIVARGMPEAHLARQMLSSRNAGLRF